MAQNKTIKADITADPKGFNKGINAALKDVKIFGKSIGDLGGKMGMLAGAAAIGAVVKGLYDMASQLGKTADRLLDLEQITGISTDKLQQYEHVARIAGVSSETMATAVQGLTQRMARGGTEAGPLNDGLKQLGMSIKDSSGNIRNGGEVMEEAIGKLAEMQNVTERNVLGAKLFSGAWKDLAPVLALGKDGINAAMKEAKELGLVLDKEALKKANDFRIEMERLNAQLQATKNETAMMFIPAMVEIGKYLNQTVNDVRVVTKALKEMLPDWMYNAGAAGLKGLHWFSTWPMQLVKLTANYVREQDKVKNANAEIAEQEWNRRVEMDRQKQIQADMIAQKHEEIRLENQRRGELGEIGRLKEDIARAEQEYIAANTDAERNRWLKRKTDLEQELAMLEKKAELELGAKEADRRGLTRGLTPIQGMGPQSAMLDTGHQEFLEQQAEKQFALKQTQQQAEQTAQSVVDMNGAMLDSAYAIGAAFGEMAANSDKSTEEILGNMLKQVIGAIINSIMVAVPFPANLLAAAGAGALGSSLFSSIPGFATGTDYAPGGMAWVGERGPELVNLPRGSQVFTNQESMGMGGKVEFEIKGRRLRGILNSENSRLNQIG
jgi:hypothetical protein